MTRPRVEVRDKARTWRESRSLPAPGEAEDDESHGRPTCRRARRRQVVADVVDDRGAGESLITFGLTRTRSSDESLATVPHTAIGIAAGIPPACSPLLHCAYEPGHASLCS